MWLCKWFNIQSRFTNNKKIINGYDTLRENTEISRHSSSTRYGVKGPGIDSRWGRSFPLLSRPDLEPAGLVSREFAGCCSILQTGHMFCCIPQGAC